jgi:hypothetical protein
MRFDINLPAGIACAALYSAGLDAEGFTDLTIAESCGDARFPATLKCRCRRDPSVKCSVTIHSFGENERIDRKRDKAGKLVFTRSGKPKNPTRVTVEIDDGKIGREVRKELDRCSFENDGEIVSWQEHCDTWNRIDEVLKRDKLSYDKLEQGKGPMPRRAIEALIELAARLDPVRHENIHCLFDNHNIAKADRLLAAKWLIQQFERDQWYLDDQLSTRIYEQTCPQIADDLIRLINDKKYGDERWPLALSLARTRHPKAADVIVTLLGQGVNTRGALEALGKLPAHKHIEKMRKYLRDPDSDVRRQARKTLQKLGVAFEAPPPPVHLVKNRKAIPKGLEEWSTNLDMDELAPTLEKLSRCVEKGFGKDEIAEVLGVVEEMPAEQTRAFRFPVVAGRKSGDVWIVIFMDDIDSPDLEVYADTQLIRKLGHLTPPDEP